MSLIDKVLPLLAVRAATDPDDAKLLEMFTRADEISSEPPERVGDIETSQAVVEPSLSAWVSRDPCEVVHEMSARRY